MQVSQQRHQRMLLNLILLAVVLIRRVCSQAHGASGELDSSAGHGNKARGHQNTAASICDVYSSKLFGNSTLATQKLLMTVYVNTAMSGNYSILNTGVSVPGVVNPGLFDGKVINQRPWFDGELNSTNVTPDVGYGIPVNWLDGGGVSALHSNLPAADSDSNQLYVEST